MSNLIKTKLTTPNRTVSATSIFAKQVESRSVSAPMRLLSQPKTPIVEPLRNRARPGWDKQQRPPVNMAHLFSPAQSPVEAAKGKQKGSESSESVPTKKSGRRNRSLMRPAAWMDVHPFAPTLHKWEKGVPVDCGEDWTMETLELALAKGPHSR